MKVINVNASDLSVNAILAEWAKAESEKEKIKAAAMADAAITVNKGKLTSIEKAKLLQIAAHLDSYNIKKLVVDKTLGEEVAIRVTEFISDMCELADEYKVDRDVHIKNIVTTLAVLCDKETFKDLNTKSIGGCDA